MNEVKTACFTGHRPDKLGGYDETNPITERVKQFLKQAIEKATEKGYSCFISGMALGTDIYAAEEVLDQGLDLVAAVPCLNQTKKWPESSKERYNRILDKATVHIISEKWHGGTMQIRNEWMVDNSDLVIAVWNHDETIRSGTKNCIEYALKNQKKVICFNPNSGTFNELS